MKQTGKFHIVGVAGTGMSALAQAMIASGFHVSGSDRYIDQKKPLPVLTRLEKAGVLLCAQNGSGVTGDLQGLVVSSAIEKDNPDVIQASILGVPIIQRADMLSRLIGSDMCIAIAGTCGKTTVTGMAGWLLEQCGMDPFVVNGDSVISWENEQATGSVRSADSSLWVVEADESDRSFLHFAPAYAIITNISLDHFSLDESIDLFNAFASQVSRRIICTPTVAKMLHTIPEKMKRVSSPSLLKDNEGWYFVLEGLVFRVPQPGRHNAENAFLAVSLCSELGLEPEALQVALKCFPGIRRRLEHKGGSSSVVVFDDYAHNPEKIRAAWTTLKESHQRIIGVWKPHGFKPLASMSSALCSVFKEIVTGSDALYILPVYYAGGTTSRTLTSREFVDLLQANTINAHFAADYDDLIETLCETITDSSCVLCMGARDPDLPIFSNNLAKCLSQK